MARKYVWIVTRCSDGKTVEVVRQCETMQGARATSNLMDYCGFEGPVPADMYPVGKTWPVDGEEAAA